MKKITKSMLSIMSAIFLATGVFAADQVVPQSVTFTNYRGQAVETITSAGTIYQGATLRLTNCVAMSSTTATNTVQGLDAVTVQCAVGNTTTSVTYSATVTSTNNGMWACDIVVPTNMTSFSVQVKLTDANTNSFIYPNKNFIGEESLF